MFTDIAGFTSLMEKNEAEGMEAHAMINSSLNDLKYQNIKDRSEVHGILADSYSALKGCEFPDLVSTDKCIEGYRRMISNAYDTLIEIADRIDDRSLRKTFLEEIPDHREIVRKFGELDDRPG